MNHTGQPTTQPAAQPMSSVPLGASHFFEGAKLMWHPSLRLYCLVPILANIILFCLITAFFFAQYREVIDFFLEFIPTWLAPLAWIVFVIVGVLLVIIYGYSFNLITNIIAAPFYGLLAEKAQEILTGQPLESEALLPMTIRVVGRELLKLWYFLSRGFLIILITILVATIPIIQVIAPLIGLAWSAWSMSIQYADYAADNNQRSFKRLRHCLWSSKSTSFGFGGTVMLLSTIPVINIFVIPAAVTGGTIYWTRQLSHSCR